MRSCPSCQTQYTDDTLRFCLQDGTPLQAVPVTQQPTVSLEGRETETRMRGPESVATQWRSGEDETRVTARPPRQKGRSGTFLVLAGAAAVFLLLALAGAAGLWLYFRPSPKDIAKNTNDGPRNGNATPPGNFNVNALTPTPSPTREPSPSPSATRPTNGNSFNWPPYLLGTPTPTPDRAKASQEVGARVGNWRYQTEAGDLNGLIGSYAPSVDYYNRRGASREFIRGDKQRAYKLYNSMSIRLSNVDVSVSDSGETATALFDKEWVFTGASRSAGKVRQQLRFAKINGQWLITSERDVKVYYTN